jgi:hypothetical protein
MRFWHGNGWCVQEQVTMPGYVTLGRLAAFAAEHGVPGDAEVSAQVRYEEQGPEITITWYVPGPGGDGAP